MFGEEVGIKKENKELLISPKNQFTCRRSHSSTEIFGLDSSQETRLLQMLMMGTKNNDVI